MACGVVRFLHPPTAIHSAVYCHFYNKWEKSLVVAGLNFIQVYRLNLQPTQSSGTEYEELANRVKDLDVQEIITDEENLYGSSSPGQKSATEFGFSSESVRLESLASYELFGTICDVKAAYVPNSNRDLLLISFADAKLSVVQYDPIVNDLRTISLHDYEAWKFSEEMPTNLARADPIIRIDPDNRCGVMRVYRSQLAVIPFVQQPPRSDNALSGPKPASQLKSFVVNLKHIKEDSVEFIQDFQFLPGYLEPTIAVLCHRTMSWAGRIAVSNDTCYIAALSVNTREKSYHVIWTCMGLPFDSLYIKNVPRPVGGLLVVTTGALVYVNQGVPTHGVSLNSVFMGVPRFPLKPEPNIVASLDGSQCSFFDTERMLLSLRNGNAYVITVVYDTVARLIRDFHFQQVMVGRYVSCIVPLEGGYVFLGGRTSDSTLYTYNTSPWIEADAAEPDDDMIGEVSLRGARKRPVMDKEDEDDIYGPNAFETVVTALRKYHFKICDTIVNIGPCRTSALGEPINLTEDSSKISDKDADLVVSSGFEHESYIAAMHRSIRPDVVASFDLLDAQDLWTLKGRNGKEHSYVVVSTADRTSVFKSGEEIVEADDHPFLGEERTIQCFQVQNGSVSFQVLKNHIRVSKSTSAEQVMLPLDENEEIHSASGSGPVFALLTNVGKLIVLRWDETTETLDELDSSRIVCPDNGPIAVSVYIDRSGLFTCSKPAGVSSTSVEVEPEVAIEPVKMEAQPEDEDELLYGSHNATSDHHRDKFETTSEELLKQLYKDRVDLLPNGPTEWLIMVRKDTSLAIFNLANFDLVFESHPIIHAPRVIHDTTALELPPAPLEMIIEACHDLVIREILLVGLGVRSTQPYLFLAVNEDVFIYHVIPFHYGSNEARLRIMFSRIKHDMLTRERRLKKKLMREISVDEAENKLARKLLRVFENVHGYSGVFLCFPYPFMTIITDRNVLRCHPMTIDGPIKSFAEFNNASCNTGFLYYNSRKQIRVAELEPFWNYDFSWPMKKVKVPGTVHFLSYHLECKVYTVCTSRNVPEKRVVQGGVDQVEMEVVERDTRFIYPTLPIFSIYLVTPDDWQLVPDASYTLQEFEHVTAMKVLALRNGTETGMKEYVVIGTNFSYGEDVQSRGRIVLLDILDVNPEPDQPLSRFKQKEIYAEEQKGPVTAICGVNGNIVSAIGQKIFIWSLKGTSLVGVAFLDVQIYVHQLTSIKDLILVADIQRSVSICRFQEKYRTLSLVSSDPNQMHTYATEFCVDGQSLTVAVTDIRQDLHVFQFDPDYYFSAFGNRLVRRMECNLGQFVTNMFRMRCAAWYPDAERVANVALTKKHLTMFVTLDGAVGCYMNIPEKTYRRILMIETILSNHCSHRAGLSPRLYWNAKVSPEQRFDLVGNIKTIADGKVGSLYMELDQTEKHEVAMKIGCSVDALIEELLDIDRQTSVL